MILGTNSDSRPEDPSMRLALLFLISFACTFDTAHGQSSTWIWSKKELKEIAALEKSATVDGAWHVVETDLWLVRTEIDSRFSAELARFMDRFDEAFAELITGLHDGRKIPKKPTVVIYANKATYEAEFPGGSRGYFRWRHGSEQFEEFHVYSFIERPEEREFKFFYTPILIHEGTHLLLRTYLGKGHAPLWFDEGMATYFQFWNLKQSGKQNLASRYSRSFYRDPLKSAYLEGPPTLAGLFGVQKWNPDNMGPKAKRNYALAESMVDFMLSSRGGRKIFKRTFERIRTGESLFSEKELAKIEPGWHAHIRKTLRLKK